MIETETTTVLKIMPHAAARSISSPLVIALSCSGGAGQHWEKLTRALGPMFRLISPDLIGCADTSHWGGKSPFELADEARPIVEIIDAWNGPVHLVGHSYGGGVALRVAVERPARIVSLSLYEPAAFHVLRAAGEDGQVAFAEIRTLAAEVGRHVVTGAYLAAARCLIDCWYRAGTFEALKPDVQLNLVRHVPKACLALRALIEERTPLVAYRRLRVPLRLMISQHAPAATELLARKLATAMNPGALRILAGAGHMGPMGHSESVVEMILEHIAASDPTAAWYQTLSTRQAA